jgi:hypothetical protein
MLLESERPAELEDVDAEFARRWSWWAWTPDVERSLLVEALGRGDEEAVAVLMKVGERRGEFRRWETCYAVQEYRGRDGDVICDEDGRPIVFRWWDAKDEGCVCMMRALESDVLFEYLVGDRDGSRISCGCCGLTYVAQQIHRDPGFSIEGWIAGQRAKRAARALPAAVAVAPVEQARATPPPDEPEPELAAEEPEAVPVEPEPDPHWRVPVEARWRSSQRTSEGWEFLISSPTGF